MADLILKDVRLPDGKVTDIVVEKGRVVHIGSSNGFSSETVFSGHNRLILPAATDMHVHMRDSIQGVKEDWGTGTMSAVAGGVATVVDQPNSIPPMETKENLLNRIAIAKEKAFCRFAVNGSLTENADIKSLASAGALAFGEMFAGPSSYGSALSPETIARVTREAADIGKLITVHAETVTEGAVKSLQAHSASRSGAGEAEAVSLVRSLAPEHARLHFCHLSSVASIAAVRGQDTFEVAPHHLFLSYEDTGCSFTDTHKKMNPPLRSKSERLRLIQKFDMIPVIASDHAPHTEEEKYAEFSNAPSGVPGVETMLPLLMKEVFEGRFTLASVIEKTVTNPNTILGIESPGFIKGARADFAIYNPSPETIRGEKLHSKCGWTPYEGMHGLFPAATVVSGVLAWDGSEFSREGSEPV